jgi:hypothetical protein
MDSPSFYNPQESSKICALIANLIEREGGSVNTNDIGVIAAYRKQVQHIRVILRGKGLGAVRVGTVDDYQGQEEKVIFISTVVSRKHWMHSANPCNLLSSPHRFNVAVTRAKALLVIVGNPHTLAADEHWNKMLRFCIERGCYTGVPAPSMFSDACEGGLDADDESVVIGANETTEEMIDKIEVQLANLLGGAAHELMYPDPDSEEAVGNSFRESYDMEWRVML